MALIIVGVVLIVVAAILYFVSRSNARLAMAAGSTEVSTIGDLRKLYQKVAGVLLSALWVAALNLIRIVTVFIAGVYRPDLFNALHEDVWAILLTGSMVVFAVVWVRWVSGTPKPAIPQG